jgi:hypothetical protein
LNGWRGDLMKIKEEMIGKEVVDVNAMIVAK